MIGLGSFLITVKVKFSWTALENCALVRDGTLERGSSPRAHGFDQRRDRRVRSRWFLEMLVRIVNSFGSKSHGPSHTPPFRALIT
jgi:hypothetical protein